MFTSQQLKQRLSVVPDVRHYYVGLSGGLDSMVLLHALASLALPVRAIHVHHGLSSNADSWQQHCEAVCQALGVPLTVSRVEVRSEGAGVEEAARRARYQVFAQVIGPGDLLLLGHHRDDQAETVLYRLLRGSGPRGLGAMSASRVLGAGRLLRPLLDQPRAALEDYARAHDLSWVEDESNQSRHYDRNYLRHEVLPVINARWPDAAAALAGSAELCREVDTLLGELAALDLKSLVSASAPSDKCLPWSGLAGLSLARRHNLLRYWFQQAGMAAPGRQHLDELDAQFFGVGVVASDCHERELCSGEWRVRVFAGSLYLLPSADWQPPAEGLWLDWLKPAQGITLPGGDTLAWRPASRPGTGLAPRWLDSRWQVTWRRGGERCRPAGREHSQTVKKLLQEYRLPTWLRARVPLLMVEGELAAVGDLWVCEAFSAAPDETGYQCHWL